MRRGLVAAPIPIGMLTSSHSTAAPIASEVVAPRPWCNVCRTGTWFEKATPKSK